MDAVRIEHLFSGPLGVQMGKRGEPNDADFVRSGEPEYLTTALDEALIALKRRVAALEESDDMKMWIQHSMGDLEMVSESVKGKPSEISHFACFQLWCFSATVLNLIHAYLIKKHL